ncbi:hypothetical protein DFJ73DRAFT_809683 [Zopfochytrium polystomum]|nr:hypothetical protein DFJ73DRAFT_809683 [Zopfochytrium polystomum]
MDEPAEFTRTTTLRGALPRDQTRSFVRCLPTLEEESLEALEEYEADTRPAAKAFEGLSFRANQFSLNLRRPLPTKFTSESSLKSRSVSKDRMLPCGSRAATVDDDDVPLSELFCEQLEPGEPVGKRAKTGENRDSATTLDGGAENSARASVSSTFEQATTETQSGTPQKVDFRELEVDGRTFSYGPAASLSYPLSVGSSSKTLEDASAGTACAGGGGLVVEGGPQSEAVSDNSATLLGRFKDLFKSSAQKRREVKGKTPLRDLV